jgi:ABC-type amino acid transport substrate-binding protein
MDILSTIKINSKKDAFVRLPAILFFTMLLLGCNSKPNFTPEELLYIKTQSITWAVEDNFPPFVFFRNGVIDGKSKDYLDLISKKSGLIFVEKASCQLVECFNWLDNGSVELITSVRTTPDLAVRATFTRPYLYVSSVIIQRKKFATTIGVGKGYAVKNYLVRERQDLEITEYPDDETAILALIAGEVDSVALDRESANVLIKKYSIDYNQVEIPHEYPLSFAITKNDNLLLSILDKTIDSITESEKDEINKKWK